MTDYRVIVNYLPAHFEGDEKPKGGPLEIENFFVAGGQRKGLEGGQEPSKTLLGFFYKRENKSSNVRVDNI